MLDRLYMIPTPRISVNSETQVIEKRAPTDESIRLAKEYGEKAWKAVESRVLADIPSIDAQLVAAQDTLYDNQVHILLKINGRQIHLTIDRLMAGDQRKMIEMVADELKDELMNLLLCTFKL